MRLDPKDPPGRANRKARAFEAEIARLRMEGYTCEAIRVALADIGLSVSLSTVQREARRGRREKEAAATSRTSPTTSGRLVESATTQASPSVLFDDTRTSQEIAEAFVKSRITNPLLRSRSLK